MKKALIVGALLICFCLSAMAQNNITPDRKAAIDSLALEKVRDLSQYISIIGNKKTPWSEASRVIERATELFADGSEISVSSLYRTEILHFPVKKYFLRLAALNYDRVNITWFKIQYISDLELQPDGRYVGVITIYQRFEGIMDDGMKYMDVTKKDITIYVEKKSTQIEGEVVDFWDVMLGDIQVKETTR